MTERLNFQGKKTSMKELLAAATFLGDGRECEEINSILANSPRQIRIRKLKLIRNGGNYFIPVTYSKSGVITSIQVPPQVTGMERFHRYFANAQESPIANGGEITDLIGAPAREAWEGVLELRKQYGNPSELQKYAEFNTQDGLIHGMGDLRNLVLLNKYLATRNARTLTFQEGMEEDRKGKLSNGVWRPFGVAVYSPQSPNKDFAEYLIREGDKRGLKAPILIHPHAFDLSENGIQILLAKDFNPELFVSGEQARAELNKFTHVGYSGALRLNRNRNGRWYAGWGDLFASGEFCRVDKIRGGAATSKNRKK